MMPFPAEIITLLGSTIVGSIISMVGAKQKLQAELHSRMMGTAKMVAKNQKQAREYKNAGFQWTRRIIAITVVLAVIVLPKVLAIFYPWMSISYGWTAFHPGVLFMPDESVLEWQAVRGLVITPLDTQMVSAIIGLYFGGSLASHHK